MEHEKPLILFHASRNPHITVFEPRAETTRDKNEGPRVFATPNRAIASLFLVATDDSWVQSGAINGVPYIIISDEERFRAMDTGGAIYSLPSDTFVYNPNKGLGELEWTSTEAVCAINIEHVQSAITDMHTHGVKVYFVNPDTFNAIQTAPDDGASIIANLNSIES